jgi:hypothetical protein
MGWKIEPRYIGMFDILGFRALLERHGTAGLVGRVEALFDSIRKEMRWEARAVTFSDTVLLYSRPLRLSHIELHTEVDRREASNFLRFCAFLLADSVVAGLPLRGAVAYGDCVCIPTRGVFFGQPIVDAYLLESQQDWIGVALHESCWALGSPRSFDRVVMQAQIPMKGSSTPVDGWTLAWPLMTGRPVALQETFRSYVDMNASTPHRQRWQHSWEFLERLVAGLKPPEPGWLNGYPATHRER